MSDVGGGTAPRSRCIGVRQGRFRHGPAWRMAIGVGTAVLLTGVALLRRTGAASPGRQNAVGPRSHLGWLGLAIVLQGRIDGNVSPGCNSGALANAGLRLPIVQFRWRFAFAGNAVAVTVPVAGTTASAALHVPPVRRARRERNDGRVGRWRSPACSPPPPSAVLVGVGALAQRQSDRRRSRHHQHRPLAAVPSCSASIAAVRSVRLRPTTAAHRHRPRWTIIKADHVTASCNDPKVIVDDCHHPSSPRSDLRPGRRGRCLTEPRFRHPQLGVRRDLPVGGPTKRFDVSMPVREPRPRVLGSRRRPRSLSLTHRQASATVEAAIPPWPSRTSAPTASTRSPPAGGVPSHQHLAGLAPSAGWCSPRWRTPHVRPTSPAEEQTGRIRYPTRGPPTRTSRKPRRPTFGDAARSVVGWRSRTRGCLVAVRTVRPGCREGAEGC